MTAAGISTGLLGHTVLASLGLGTILMSSEIVFSVIKYLGAAYLLYLGIQLLRSHSEGMDLTTSSKQSGWSQFSTGALSNLSNPKITLFYFAYLPQFFSVETENPTHYLLILGGSFALLTFLVKGVIGYLCGRFSAWFQTRPKAFTALSQISGTVLIGLGVKLAFEQRA